MKKYFIILGRYLYCLMSQAELYCALIKSWEPDYAVDRSESSIQAFEKKDTEKMPAPGGIVFTGSSTFTKWQNAAEDLAPLADY